MPRYCSAYCPIWGPEVRSQGRLDNPGSRVGFGFHASSPGLLAARYPAKVAVPLMRTQFWYVPGSTGRVIPVGSYVPLPAIPLNFPVP